MNTLKLFVLRKFKTLTILTTTMAFSLMLLMIRMKITHSFFYLFLVWNLFLAVIPFAISSYLVCLPKPSKLISLTWFGVWLLFLPNAPYMITDLLHIRISETKYIWLDILVVKSFALCGVLLFYLSILDMGKVFAIYVKKAVLDFCLILIILLSSFGVYLGRFLRYNSWEILTNPKHLLLDIANIAIKPIAHNEAWLFTLFFGTFLGIGFWVFNTLSLREN